MRSNGCTRRPVRQKTVTKGVHLVLSRKNISSRGDISRCGEIYFVNDTKDSLTIYKFT